MPCIGYRHQVQTARNGTSSTAEDTEPRRTHVSEGIGAENAEVLIASATGELLIVGWELDRRLENVLRHGRSHTYIIDEFPQNVNQ